MVIVDAAPARSSARRWNAPICVNSRVLLLAGVLAVQDHDLDLSMSFADLTWGRGGSRESAPGTARLLPPPDIDSDAGRPGPHGGLARSATPYLMYRG